jgi:hypothetical protein
MHISRQEKDNRIRASWQSPKSEMKCDIQVEEWKAQTVYNTTEGEQHKNTNNSTEKSQNQDATIRILAPRHNIKFP